MWPVAALEVLARKNERRENLESGACEAPSVMTDKRSEAGIAILLVAGSRNDDAGFCGSGSRVPKTDMLDSRELVKTQ